MNHLLVLIVNMLLISVVQQLLQIKFNFVLNIYLPPLSSPEYQKLLHDEKSIDDDEDNYLFNNISQNRNNNNNNTTTNEVPMRKSSTTNISTSLVDDYG